MSAMMTTADLRSLLTDRLARLEDRIRAACDRAGRRRSEVTLVAVTKSVGPTAATILTELGVLDLGESRPQE
ncbi:MAG TPA: YggS family pyridoxal phosphate-dependent enzyme, partial [Gemmataceae bacterium]|nr:YggS family pyridoxal phosphate-dependent enzyme [Gemmataceae bacterium]